MRTTGQPLKSTPIGQLITYEDMANPRRTYRIDYIFVSGGYGLTDIESGDFIYSACRQHGWKPANGRKAVAS
jgi:hypothetical protein